MTPRFWSPVVGNSEPIAKELVDECEIADALIEV